ncbi:formyltransferase family protein [Pseudoalteromonas sp. DL-6]|uniref:formyltransferase family protein n=1 Tax=Pseudoalteromonas sp. DL-6 TaxID=1390185 RepID=UPI0010C426D8|nr:formyltransferase family protein [Pseudoalteromonas sp. DL-6]QBJ61974.1 formyl transferase [Pseudoalteromonas sp. DL-6]
MDKIKVLFMGRKPVAGNSLRWLLSKESVEVVGVVTDSHLPQSVCAGIANKSGVPLFSFEEALAKTNSGELVFDLGLSMLFWRKLKEGLIHSPKLKTINFHPAPLPEYKGTAGYNLAILDGLDEWSMTAHYVDEEIDTGEIIELQRFSICKDTETAQSLEKISQEYLFKLFVNVVERVLETKGILPTTPNHGGRYISRADMESMKEIKEGDDISRKIRAFWFPPYDGAYITIGGNKFTLVDEYILNSLADSSVSRVF